MNRRTLKLKWLGIDARQEIVIFMREDCHICKSEGFIALSRVVVKNKNRTVVATIHTVSSDILDVGEASITQNGWKELHANEGDEIAIEHLLPIESFRKVRAKLFGEELSGGDFREIIDDISRGMYSNIQIAAFISGCVGHRVSVSEIKSLTHAMVEVGQRLHWDSPIVVDKHSVGGLPGNRTTPIIVSIVAAGGLLIPKTSSQAITSPSGTANTMATMTSVDLTLDKLKEVVHQEGGCFAWGGAVNLSPTDDTLIKVERALDIDSEGQMIASVLSKKAAAGSTHVVLDIPIGPTAKVRSKSAAIELKRKLIEVGRSENLELVVLFSDGSQPVGVGIGPALEAKDVLRILKRSPDAPQDLKEKAIHMAGVLFEMAGKSSPGEGMHLARDLLQSGEAEKKFYAICEAQGGFRSPPTAPYTHDVVSEKQGTVASIDNRKLARIAKLAGAPNEQAAGIEFFAKLGTRFKKGDILFRIHSEAPGELEYALNYYLSDRNIIELKDE